MGDERIDRILRFWFGDNVEDAALDGSRSALWWSKDAGVDDRIRRKFAALVDVAAAGDLASWEVSARGRLALILLTDQFPRNIYRETERSFAYDHFALSKCKTGLEQGVDRQLLPIQRLFFYLPLEHSEDLENQEHCVQLFRKLVHEAPPGQEDAFRGFVDFAEKHREIIARFGRFPHRNAILGRSSTAEEQEFLKQPGSGF